MNEVYMKLLVTDENKLALVTLQWFDEVGTSNVYLKKKKEYESDEDEDMVFTSEEEAVAFCIENVRLSMVDADLYALCTAKQKNDGFYKD